MFVDEFHVEIKTSQIYNSSIKDHSAIVSADNDSLIIILVLAMSSEEIEDIMYRVTS